MVEVPFFANTPDDTHCFQAALRMVLAYFQPDTNYTWEKLDTITAKQPGMWTWPMAGLTWLSKHGFEVVTIEKFDYAAFIAHPKDYLIGVYGPDVAQEQIAHSVLEIEIVQARAFTQRVKAEQRLPTISDIQRLLADGYLVIINVNAATLNDHSGYVGHFVVITRCSEEDITLHDPGLPPIPNRVVPIASFERAWADPDETAKTLMAFRPRV